MSKPRLIAFYLPQFYPTKENDEWWEKNFTEWTNVRRAKPLFSGHEQPRVPADLGYYDLRDPEIREKQADLAREAGIEGFCYWHYWFAGRRLLDRVFREVVESGKPDYPFCLCWANHSWYRKTWDSSHSDTLLMEQTYPGRQDYIAHFNAMLPAFKDKRYMTVDGKPIFGIFDSLGFGKDRFAEFKQIWNELAKENGLPGFYFFAFTTKIGKINDIDGFGYSLTVVDYMGEVFRRTKTIPKYWRRFKRLFTRLPDKVYSYDYYAETVLKSFPSYPDVSPCLVPNFDHSPRSKDRGFVLSGDSPEKWSELCKAVFRLCKEKKEEENLVFIKSWNEWGEGNYLEPDTRYGKGYVCKTREAIGQ